MYAINTTRTTNFETANILRVMLQAEGFPALAATVEFRGETLHYCMSVAPALFPRMFGLLAIGFAAQPDGLSEAKRIGAAQTGRNPVAVPEGLHATVLEALHLALTEVSDRVVSVEPAPRTEVKPANGIVTLGAENHDPGDEDTTKPVRTPVNPLGGGWDNRCVDEHGNVRSMSRDEYDSWTSGT